MGFDVASFYLFTPLPDCADLVRPLRDLLGGHGLRGTVLLAAEGINGTLAGEPPALASAMDALAGDPAFAGRFQPLQIRWSTAASMPFGRLKVRLRPEIVTLGDPTIDPAVRVGTYVEPAEWNRLLADPDLLLLDTRNAFEVALGSFPGALDPSLDRFSQFPEFVEQRLATSRDRPIAMFCTGGIRCEKASAYLLARGFTQVYHLKGGILNYLETIRPQDSLWSGDCFVFDGRGALGHGLVERAVKRLEAAI